MSRTARPPCAVTVDVECEWESGSPRAVEDHLPRLLELLEARAIPATLFCTGEMVEKSPAILREAGARHELASHAWSHTSFGRLSRAEIRDELRRSKQAVAELGRPCHGFRAPYFYMTEEILADVAAAGYRYDSSLASFAMHIGHRNLLRSKRPRVVDAGGRPITLLPIPDATPARIPFGLSYYRLFHPFSRLFHRETPHVVYLHCDEFLAEGPRQTERETAIPRHVRPFLNRHRGTKAWNLLENLLDALARKGMDFVTCGQLAASVVRPASAR